MKTVSIFGGSGFIGSKLITHLAKQKIQIRLFTQKKVKANHLKVLPNLKLFEYNETTDLKTLLAGSDVVINCIGILHEDKKNSFHQIHALWLKKLTHTLNQLKIKRFIHLSALGASKEGPSNYLKSKFEGETYIKKNLKATAWTIFRPSIVFGEQDSFINLFRKLLNFLPILMLVSPQSKFQPIACEDLVEMMLKSLQDKKTFNKTYNVGGPKVYSFIEIIRIILEASGQKRIIIPLPKNLSWMMVWFLELLPVKLITRDNLKSMSVDNIVNINDAYQFKSTLKDLAIYLKETG